MPDFVFSTTASSFTNRFREQILSFDCEAFPESQSTRNRKTDGITDEKMKQFDLEMSKGTLSNNDIIPPPSFSQGDIPFTYA
jgi:general transcription factor 3C polypeptide 5 (transcription factor C subunit 1)